MWADCCKILKVTNFLPQHSREISRLQSCDRSIGKLRQYQNKLYMVFLAERPRYFAIGDRYKLCIWPCGTCRFSLGQEECVRVANKINRSNSTSVDRGLVCGVYSISCIKFNRIWSTGILQQLPTPLGRNQKGLFAAGIWPWTA